MLPRDKITLAYLPPSLGDEERKLNKMCTFAETMAWYFRFTFDALKETKNVYIALPSVRNCLQPFDSRKTKKSRKTGKSRKTKKQRGGQCYGRGIGANNYDPNFSIYNTNELQLFPYKPTN